MAALMLTAILITASSLLGIVFYTALVTIGTSTDQQLWSRPTRHPNDIRSDLGTFDKSAFGFVIHGGQVYHVTGNTFDDNIHDQKYRPSYILETDSLPDDLRLYPTVGNGHIGTVVHGPYVHMNGFYNGYMTASIRAIIPSTCAVRVGNLTLGNRQPMSDTSRKYQLDVLRGVFLEVFSFPTDIRVTQRIYAHRTIAELLVVEIEVDRSDTSSAIELTLDVTPWKDYPDVIYTTLPSDIPNVIHKKGRIVTPETNSSGHTEVHIYYDKISDTLTVPPGVAKIKWIYMTAIHPQSGTALHAYITGTMMVRTGQLYELHVKAWIKLWNRGRVTVEGDDNLAKAIYASYYNILSSMPLVEDPTWPYVGLSPGGLQWGSRENYGGHVFWDQETWMYPAILLLHSDLGKVLLNTRKRTMVSAAKNAVKYGNKGLKYPWESAFSGFETTDSYICATQEIHINGDIAFAVTQYLQATHDYDILTKDSFADILMGIGDFWLSKLQWNSSRKMYDINGVQSPDEYHYNISNSVFVNSVADLALHSAILAAEATGKTAEKYQRAVGRIYLPYDSLHGYHPEYEGYKPGVIVKQADVVLLGYPLMVNMSQETRKTDLDLYENVTDRNGPAMTWGMFAIGHLELKQFKQAEELFRRAYLPYMAGPFHVWTEMIDGEGCTNFITGAGGFLQSVLFGYGGFRLKSDRLLFDPELPPNTTSVIFTGIDYSGFTLDIEYSAQKMTIELTGVKSKAASLYIMYGVHQETKLRLHRHLTLQRQSATFLPMFGIKQ